VFMVIGYLWYGPLFGKQWSSGTGIPMSNDMNPPLLIQTAIYSLVASIGVAYLGVLDDVEHALVSSLLVAILFIAPVLWSSVVWAKKNTTVWFIDVSYWFVAIAVVVFVQGLF
jgi:hypothetical protein